MLYLPQSTQNFHVLKSNLATISASDFAAVFGVNIHKSKGAFWRQIHNKDEPKRETFQSPAMTHGKNEEPFARSKFLEEFRRNNPALYVREHIECGTGFLQKDPRFCASPDGLFSWSTNDFDYQREGYELKNPWSTDVPQSVYHGMAGNVLQCVLNMEVFNTQVWNLFYYKRKTGEFSWFRIHRNKDYFDRYLYPEAVKFLEDTSRQEPRMGRGERQKVSLEILNSLKIDHVMYEPGKNNSDEEFEIK